MAANGVIPAGSLQNALQVLADQFYRGTDAPSNSNLDEGDLWYDTDDNQLKVYRETSTNTFEFVPLAQASGTMDSLMEAGFKEKKWQTLLKLREVTAQTLLQ